jgi:hypothetical protein
VELEALKLMRMGTVRGAPARSAAVRVSVISINLAKTLLVSMITLVILRRKQTLLFYERLLVLVAPIAHQQQDRF